MAFMGISYLAIVLAAIVSFIFGALYYMALAKPWMKAAGIDPASRNSSPMPFILAFIGELLMAFMLAGVIGHLSGGVTISSATISAFFIWVGFVLTTQIINHQYQMKPWSLTVIDSGHWLGVLFLQGLVIGWIGV